MTATRKRGRPRSVATIQRENELAEIEKVLQDAAARCSMSCKDRKEMNDLIESLDRWEAQILSDYHLSPMRKETAYAMASLGDESVAGYEEVIITEYEKAKSLGVKVRTVGTKSSASAAKDRKDQFLKEYAGAIDGWLKQGWSNSRIAKRVCKPPLGKLGLSVRTIRRWIAEYRAK
ncbi:MAG: hypothetical protein FJ184_15010 [Gammaproteobacteria bacterium]|nr:hypothetical protein [Gammaproteobacteria bacterium]